MSGRNGFRYGLFLKKNLAGLFILLTIGLFFTAFGDSTAAENLIVLETIPFYHDTGGKTESVKKVEAYDEEKDVEARFTSLIGSDDITYQPETDMGINTKHEKVTITEEDIGQLKNFDFLKRSFYIVDGRTELAAEDVNVDKFANWDLSINNSISGPKILIFHTHASEKFIGSNQTDTNSGIVQTGDVLKSILETQYGIEVLHHKGIYDMTDGKSNRNGAYERMEPDIRKILQENPSIQMVIDLHRDGVNEGVHLVTDIDGKACAQVMFFNGLCKLNKNGVTSPISGLSNPYVEDNLALSFQMQLTANKLYPSLTRKIYVNAYRYSLHMLPKSMLIEVGAQTNTQQEADNAMEPLASVLAEVLLNQ